MKLIVGILMVFFLTACGGGNDDGNTTNTSHEKEKRNQDNQALWTSKNTGFYSYSFSSNCICPNKINSLKAPVEIVVNDYNITSILQEQDKSIVTNQQGYLTVEQVFQIVSDAIKRNADKVIVSYDQKLGYPDKIYIDDKLSKLDDAVTYTLSVLSIDGVTINKSATQINNENLAIWQSKNTGDYRYQYQRNFLSEPNQAVNIVVVNNTISSAMPISGTSNANTGARKPNYRTVEQAFQDITAAINNNAYVVNISYDKVLGFPRDIKIAYSALAADDKPNGVVDRLVYNISNLTLGATQITETPKQLYFKNYRLWNSQSIGNYSYQFKLGCFCAPNLKEPINNVVNNNIIISSIRESDGVDVTGNVPSVITVEQAFTKILNAMDQNVFKLEVTYDKTLGYPSSIYINPNKDLADGQKTYFISNVVIIPDELRQTQIQLYQDNFALWQSKSTGNYSHEFYRSCFCTQEMSPYVNIVVKNNVIESIIRVTDGVDISNQGALLSVDQIFQKILEAINQNVYQLIVTYDEILGYPINVSIDQDKLIIDEEVGYSVSNFMMDTGVAQKTPIQVYKANLDLWKSVTTENYSYQYNNGGFLPPASTALVNIVVNNNVFSSITRDTDGVDVINNSGSYRTVEQAFERIQEAINNNAFKVYVVYDPILGYPRIVNIKLLELAQDDSVIYSLSNLVIQ